VQIGQIHSIYRSSIPSGENMTVEDISNVLKSIGHSVSLYSFDSDSLVQSRLSVAKRALQIVSSRYSEDRVFEEWVSKQELIQIHNAFPGLTLGKLEILKESGVPIVRVIHNYRKTCLSGNHIRKGNPCFKCNVNSQLNGVFFGCYNNSYLMSIFVKTYSKLLKKFEDDTRVRYVAVSNVISEYLKNTGIAPNRILVAPNSVPQHQAINFNASEVLLLGRLEAEKGILKALDIWSKNSNLPILNIVGSGSLEKYVKIKVQGISNVNFHGYLKGLSLERVTGRCKVALILNTWDEPFGRTFAEALARGQAIVAYDRGMASEFIFPGKNGFLVEHDSDVVNAVEQSMILTHESLNSVSRSLWNEKYSPQAVKNIWENIVLKIGKEGT